MSESRMGAVSGLPAGRPLLSACVLAVGVTALAAAGFAESSLAFDRAALSFLAAVIAATAVPAILSVVAPKNFWLRLVFGALIAGLLLALRRYLGAIDTSRLSPLEPGLLLAVAAFASFALTIGAPLWRGVLRLSLIGFAALVLGVAGALGFAAFELSRQGVMPAGGPGLALAAAVGAAVSVCLAGAFAKSFAEGADHPEAAAFAVGQSAVMALFAAAVGSLALSMPAFFAAGPVLSVLYGIAVLLLLGGGVPTIFLGAALSLKIRSEAVAVEENRRRTAISSFLRRLGGLLPPSSALAASAIAIILATVAGFDLGAPIAVAQLAFIASAIVLTAVFAISLRSALLMGLMLTTALFLTTRFFETGRFGLGEEARLTALAFAAVMFFQLCIAWRDARNPRRKAREATAVALSDGLFANLASSTIGVGALAAAQAGGLWSDGLAAVGFAACLCLCGTVLAPIYMTAIGALFGRE